MPTKNLESSVGDELRSEYDLAALKGRVRGKYYARATAGTTMVLLEPDVAEAFPDGASVNQALRSYLRTSRGKLPNDRRCSRRAGRRVDKKRSAQSRLAAERRSLDCRTINGADQEDGNSSLQAGSGDVDLVSVEGRGIKVDQSYTKIANTTLAIPYLTGPWGMYSG